MQRDALSFLRCPFCGTRFSVIDNSALQQTDMTITYGVLGCECCAYPIVDGIPVLIADDLTRDAMHAMEAGYRDEALHKLLGLTRARAARFVALTSGKHEPTYRQLLSLLTSDAEADYFFFRFSDPTYRTAEAILRSVVEKHCNAGIALDLCGGSGHLTRVLLERQFPGGTVLADVYYWKLWLAHRRVAIGCTPICCDANNPLPFTDLTFSSVVLSDAFPYLWHKRLCAGEMIRVSINDGIIVMSHLHSASGKNISEGDTLTPAAYQDLFRSRAPRLFDDQKLLDELLQYQTIDLTGNLSPSELGSTPSITLIASKKLEIFQRATVGTQSKASGRLVVNPLYDVEYLNGRSELTRRFPSSNYEEEYAAAKFYLPEHVTVNADFRTRITAASVGNDFASLRRNCILLDVPLNYC